MTLGVVFAAGFDILGDDFLGWACLGLLLLSAPLQLLWLLGSAHYRWQRRRWPWGPRPS